MQITNKIWKAEKYTHSFMIHMHTHLKNKNLCP